MAIRVDKFKRLAYADKIQRLAGWRVENDSIRASVIKAFSKIPGIGKRIANTLFEIGITSIPKLRTTDPEGIRVGISMFSEGKIGRRSLSKVIAGIQRMTLEEWAMIEMQSIPGVGESLANDLVNSLGVKSLADLRAQDPEDLYRRIGGATVDRCVLYVFREAVYFASVEKPDPEKLKWWNWKDKK